MRIQSLPSKTIVRQLNELHSAISRGKEFHQYIMYLPDICQKFIQVWKCQGNTNFLIQALNDNDLHIGTDGTHIPDTTYGAGAAIATRYDNCNDMIMTGAHCEIENGMTSLTTKQ